MKKIIFVLLAVFILVLPGEAKNIWDDFATHVTQDNVRAFTKDLGGLIGSGTYTTGRVLGWGGFQIGPRGTMIFKMSQDKNETDQTALGNREEVGEVFYPWLQADIGMPFRLDGFIRASSYQGMTIAGGGLRWGITRPNEMLGSFQPMLVVSAHSASARDFSATHYNASLVLSMKFKYFVPYIGGGVDYTTLHINQALLAPELSGDNEYAATARATAGLNFKLPSFLDLSLAANYAYYGLGAEASVSLRF
ncbi:MAG: hypothetical protein IKJ44_02645 [Elusimicrobiaceae bacterium]|nr:hypothetical protein [Elusimicrobiaceae bacterium]MBR3899150.1 hypothetical protein [Elusimicrobiaceae bacterium]